MPPRGRPIGGTLCKALRAVRLPQMVPPQQYGEYPPAAGPPPHAFVARQVHIWRSLETYETTISPLRRRTCRPRIRRQPGGSLQSSRERRFQFEILRNGAVDLNGANPDEFAIADSAGSHD